MFSGKKDKTNSIVKRHLRDSLPYVMSPSEDRQPENIKSGSLFRYDLCQSEVPEKFRVNFAIVP